MKTQNTQRKTDMYEYVGKGYTLYDVLGEFVPELEEDYSTANLLNKSLDVIKLTPNVEIPTIELYQNIFDMISNQLLELISLRNQGKSNKLSIEMEEQLLNKIINVEENTENQYLDNYDTLEEYIIHARNNINDPSTKKIRDQIVNGGINLLDESTQSYTRYLLLRHVYVESRIGIPLKEKYKTIEEREDPRNEEWIEYQDLIQVFSNQKKCKLYDQYLSEYQQGIDKLTEEYNAKVNDFTLRQKILAKRENGANDILLSTLTDRQMQLAYQNGVVNTILGEYEEITTPPQGTYEWKFDIKEPELVCDLETNYSENGIENQRVIAVSYGEMTYNTDFTRKTNKPTYTGSGLELVGITTKGNDGIKNYFVFTRFANKTKIRNSEEFGIDTNNNTVKLLDNDTGEELSVVHDARIPENQKELYANAFFYDGYLLAVENNYGRYAGYVMQNGDKPIIMTDERDKKAIKYGTRYRGKCGDYKFSIGELCKSKSLKETHDKIVDYLLNQTKEEKNKNSKGDITQGDPR